VALSAELKRRKRKSRKRKQGIPFPYYPYYRLRRVTRGGTKPTLIRLHYCPSFLADNRPPFLTAALGNAFRLLRGGSIPSPMSSLRAFNCDVKADRNVIANVRIAITVSTNNFTSNASLRRDLAELVAQIRDGLRRCATESTEALNGAQFPTALIDRKTDCQD